MLRRIRLALMLAVSLIASTCSVSLASDGSNPASISLVYIAVLIAVMVACGLLGGVANYFLAGGTDSRGNSVAKSLVVGLAASTMVPLVLNMMSSDLLANGQTDFTKLLVFGGFCVVAAASSSRFIQTISDRLLQEVKQTAADAKQVAEKASEKVNAVEETQTEPDATSVKEAAKPLPDADESNVLGAFVAKPQYTFRYIGGLAADTEMTAEQVSNVLKALEEHGLVGHFEGQKGRRWYITALGRAAHQAAAPEASAKISRPEKDGKHAVKL